MYSCWLLIITFLSFVNDFVDSLLHYPLRNQGVVHWSVAPWIFLLGLHKHKSNVFCPQTLRHLPWSQQCFKTVDSGHSMTLASCLGTCRCTSSGPMNLHKSNLFKCSLIWSFATEGLPCSSFFQESQGPGILEGEFYK